MCIRDRPKIVQFSPEKADVSDFYKNKEIDTVISLKAETHNFPTTVEPFNGAATGSGGEIRDRLAGGKGSIPLAGTAVYMTQDIGTAIKRHEDFNFSHMTYTVGNEQDYHFKVLFLILEKLGYSWAKSCYHLSYGMVDLPSGKMKSREGTAVDLSLIHI